MILNVSGRTDIVAFYTKWFMQRYEEGYVDVRNPFNPKLISRIKFENVDAILFCTKNPIPIIPYLKKIKKPIIFHITLTPYKNDIEPNVPPKGKIIEAIKTISQIIGKENIYIRYDPVFLSNIYTINYHKQLFERLCTLTEGYVEHIIISFIDNYKNVRNNKNDLKLKEFTKKDYEQIGLSFSESAKKHKMTIQTCCEEINLIDYGFEKNDCVSHELAFKITGKIYKKQIARKDKNCACVQMVDIGVYNTCKHFCKYCYANYDELKVNENYKKHNPKSSLLIGEINEYDIIKERIK